MSHTEWVRARDREQRIKDMRWAARPNKMRNRRVWECQDCGTISPTRPHLCTIKEPTACALCQSKNVICHQSQKEFRRWKELQALQKDGQIRSLRRQVKFTFTTPEPVRVFAGLFWVDLPANYTLKTKTGQDLTYTADFVYEERITKTHGCTNTWQVVEDVKGRRKGAAYDLYWIKRELMRLCHGIEVREY